MFSKKDFPGFVIVFVAIQFIQRGCKKKNIIINCQIPEGLFKPGMATKKNLNEKFINSSFVTDVFDNSICANNKGNLYLPDALPGKDGEAGELPDMWDEIG